MSKEGRQGEQEDFDWTHNEDEKNHEQLLESGKREECIYNEHSRFFYFKYIFAKI